MFMGLTIGHSRPLDPVDSAEAGAHRLQQAVQVLLLQLAEAPAADEAVEHGPAEVWGLCAAAVEGQLLLVQQLCNTRVCGLWGVVDKLHDTCSSTTWLDSRMPSGVKAVSSHRFVQVAYVDCIHDWKL